MTERPILMSAPMVRAIRGGTKSQTRRVVNLKPFDRCCAAPHRTYVPHGPGSPGCPPDWPCYLKANYCENCDGGGDRIWPRYEVGDLLWVREAWRVGAWCVDNAEIAVDYRADGYARREWLKVPDPDQWQRLWEGSTDDAYDSGLKVDDEGEYHWKPGDSPCRWRPSIHMPRWASRLTLRVTGVRVERVQEITEEDAVAEGMTKRGVWWDAGLDWQGDGVGETARESFSVLWDTLNAKRGYGWDSNPWVWATSFERMEAP